MMSVQTGLKAGEIKGGEDAHNQTVPMYTVQHVRLVAVLDYKP